MSHDTDAVFRLPSRLAGVPTEERQREQGKEE